MRRLIAVAFTCLLFLSGIAHAGLSDGLVAYYPFNGNANDESVNTNNGTVYGATLTADRNGNENSAYYLDGVDDVINCGNSSNFNFGTGFTFACWIKVSEFNGACIFMKKRRGSENKYLRLYNDEG